ncbi:MAG: hypothetical protein WCQ21_31775 [Verrucomicrobiota bacterium]
MSQTRLPAEPRQRVYARAGGCCEYCRLPETYSFAVHQVDAKVVLSTWRAAGLDVVGVYR